MLATSPKKSKTVNCRAKARPYVDMNLAMNAAEKKDIGKALMLASKGRTDAHSASLVADRSGHCHAACGSRPGFADDCRGVGRSAPDRCLRCLIGRVPLIAVANALLPLDRTRAWEMMLEVAKASNSAEGFNGEDGRLTMQLRTKNMASMHSSTVDAV